MKNTLRKTAFCMALLTTIPTLPLSPETYDNGTEIVQNEWSQTVSKVHQEMNPSRYITEEFINAIISVESRGKPEARGKYNERGLMQITREAWWQSEKNDNFFQEAFIPEKNIRAGIKYLMWIDSCCKNWNPQWEKLKDKEKRKIIAASYNAGIGTVQRSGWDIEHENIPNITKKYIENIEKIVMLLP